MSQYHLKSPNAPTRIDLRPRAVPANDVVWSPLASRLGPLGLARTYWALWIGMLLNRLGGTMFMLLGLYLTRDRGFSPERAGLVVSLLAAGGLAAGPTGGALADRFGRRVTLLVGTSLAGALMLALGQARSLVAFLALAPLLGFFTDLCRPALQAAVADVVPPRDRARAYGLLYWAMNLGFAAAVSFGGVLASRHFGLLFVLDALTTFGYGVLVWRYVPETRPAASLLAVSPARRFLRPLGDRAFLRFVLVQLVLLLAFAQVILTLPLDMRAHGVPLPRIGWLLALNGVCIVLGQPIALRWLRRFGPAHWLSAGAVLTGLGLGTLAFAAAGTPIYVLSTFLWTAGEIGFSTAVPVIVAEFAPAAERGSYQGTYQLAWGTASTLAPALGSLVLARLGAPALWGGCLLLCLAAAALHRRVTASAISSLSSRATGPSSSLPSPTSEEAQPPP